MVVRPFAISCRTKISRKTINAQFMEQALHQAGLKRVFGVGWMNWAGMLPGN